MIVDLHYLNLKIPASILWSLNSMDIIEFNDVSNRVGEEENFDIYVIELNDFLP
jgi:hypothetical protein